MLRIQCAGCKRIMYEGLRGTCPNCNWPLSKAKLTTEEIPSREAAEHEEKWVAGVGTRQCEWWVDQDGDSKLCCRYQPGHPPPHRTCYSPGDWPEASWQRGVWKYRGRA